MISIVIPAFNEEKLLGRCLRSLQNQDYQGEYEVVVVDNNSTDKTSEIARSFGARVVFCYKRGVVAARQAGVLVSKGDIILQTDADTIVPRHWISQTILEFSDPAVVAVAGGITYLDPPFWARFNNLFHVMHSKLSYTLFKKLFTIRAANFAFRRSAFNRVGGYNTDLAIIGDEYEFPQHLSRMGTIRYVPKHIVETSSRVFEQGPLRYFIEHLFINTFCMHLLHTFTQRPVYRRIQIPLMFQTRWAALGTLFIGLMLYGFFVPTAQVFGRVYSHGPRNENLVALTFDDGPNEPYTSQILDILDHYHVKATFFVVGKNAQYSPDTVKRMVAEHHEIGLHSYDHSKMKNIVGFRKELDQAESAMESVAHVKPHIFRPPFGEKTPWGLAYAKKEGLISVAWDVSAKDPRQPSSSVIAKRILRKTKSGSIILLHDGAELSHGTSRQHTVEALPKVIEALQKRGYRFVTVAELLNISPYY